MDIGRRIKKVRKEFDLTQAEFASRIGSSQNTVARYEMGQRSPSAPIITLVCREFNVSETWLRTGEGEMFLQKEPEPLDTLLAGLLGGENVTTEDRVLIKNFLELPDDSRREVIQFVQKCAEELSAPAPAPSALDADLAAKVTALEKQNKEIIAQNQALAAEIAAIKEEDAEQENVERVQQGVSQSRSR